MNKKVIAIISIISLFIISLVATLIIMTKRATVVIEENQPTTEVIVDTNEESSEEVSESSIQVDLSNSEQSISEESILEESSSENSEEDYFIDKDDTSTITDEEGNEVNIIGGGDFDEFDLEKIEERQRLLKAASEEVLEKVYEDESVFLEDYLEKAGKFGYDRAEFTDCFDVFTTEPHLGDICIFNGPKERTSTFNISVAVYIDDNTIIALDDLFDGTAKKEKYTDELKDRLDKYASMQYIDYLFW